MTLSFGPTGDATATYTFNLASGLAALKLVAPATGGGAGGGPPIPSHLVSGACWNVSDAGAGAGHPLNPCDADDGQSDGVTVFTIPAGSWSAGPSPFPPGPYAWTSRSSDFSTSASNSPVVVYTLDPAATATITTVDSAGRSVTGACLYVYNGPGPIGELNRCDGADGATDGVVHFSHLLSISGLVARAFSAPAGLAPGNDVTLSFGPTGDATATYTFNLASGLAALKLVAPATGGGAGGGPPIPSHLVSGACWNVSDAGAGAGHPLNPCDADDGRERRRDRLHHSRRLLVGRPVALPAGTLCLDQQELRLLHVGKQQPGRRLHPRSGGHGNDHDSR